MKKADLSGTSERYFRRFAFRPPQSKNQPHPDTRLIIVIPCHDEPDLLSTLNSLHHCEAPAYPLEVILVINSSDLAEAEVKRRNLKTYKEVEAWRELTQPFFKLQIIHVDDLPPKHAGVGLARKIGMDEALHRFACIGYPGLIVCLDADCTVAPNYLRELEQTVLKYQPQSCCIHFEHDIAALEDHSLRQGILHYELHLRYYVNALAYAGFPFAMHTIGSSMAVRADVYALSGGMNRRKAGEDFYFLHKVVPLGGFHHLTKTLVFPSARVSHRVPFGTGKAQADWLLKKEGSGLTYHPQIFEDLKQFMEVSPLFFGVEETRIKKILSQLPDSVQYFLNKNQFLDLLAEMRRHSAGKDSFRKRFFSWFDGFKALKFAHSSRDCYYNNVATEEGASRMLSLLTNESCKTGNTDKLLAAYRRLDISRRHINII